MDEFAQSGFHGRRRSRSRAGHQEQGAGLTCRQPGQIGAGAAHEAPSAASALHGVHGHPGHGQRVEVSAGGAFGDLQFSGDLRRCHLLTLLQEQEDGHQPVGSHPRYFRRNRSRPDRFQSHDGDMTSTTSSTTHDRIDPRPILDRAIATGGTVIARVRPDQLTAPTPCPEMDVRTMLGHLVAVLDRIAALGRGDDPSPSPRPMHPTTAGLMPGRHRPTAPPRRGAMMPCSNNPWRCPGSRATAPTSWRPTSPS